jgi:hypothetical protein
MRISTGMLDLKRMANKISNEDGLPLTSALQSFSLLHFFVLLLQVVFPHCLYLNLALSRVLPALHDDHV